MKKVLSIYLFVFLSLVFYCFAFDFYINFDSFAAYHISSYSIKAIGVVMGVAIFYLLLSLFFRFGFFELLLGKFYKGEVSGFSKYRVVPFSVTFGLLLSEYISVISMPVLLLVVGELFYLFIINKEEGFLFF
ncbi:hypothetical protein [Shewanella fidelis]|uniref:hypothetical protein n=1 Tax=Shewanella fidelis TaxID=173509 RepID=UPI00048A9A3C|nr:hypothetical protein [Shewanella fidelis]